MKNLLPTLFNHERYQTISIIVSALLLIGFYGCEPKCFDPMNPGERITRTELDISIDTFIAKANAGYASLEQQEELRAFLLEQSLNTAATGNLNPLALITSICTILGIGAGVDNVRKRKEIKKLACYVSPTG